jgi:hypothetical protein
MEAQFTKTTEVQNIVSEGFDLGLDADIAADPAASIRKGVTTADAALSNRIVVERIGHSKHWRT